jgi:hypothetical protein
MAAMAATTSPTMNRVHASSMDPMRVICGQQRQANQQQ